MKPLLISCAISLVAICYYLSVIAMQMNDGEIPGGTNFFVATLLRVATVSALVFGCLPNPRKNEKA